jgi:hypothetical protein
MDRGRVGSKRRLHRLEPGRAVHWRDQRRSRVAEAMSRAGVLERQLVEASGRPAEPFARRGADVVLRSGDPSPVLPSEARSDFAEGGVDAEGAAAPPPSTYEPAGSVCL